MFEKIRTIIKLIDVETIDANRKKELDLLVSFIQNKKNEKSPVLLNYICTHNARRSQFAQIWSTVAADYYNVSAQSFSGGVEITAFNTRAISSLQRFGFDIDVDKGNNPKVRVKWNEQKEPIVMYSKLYDDTINPNGAFAAIMTCSHADENCPFVAGCEQRIPIRYDDPKLFDDSPLEETLYDYRSFEIATEMFYVFSKIE